MEGISPGETVTLFMTERELICRGWGTGELTEEQALSLMREKCVGRVERVEIYTSAAGILLIARQKRLRPTAQRPLRRGRVGKRL